MVCAKLYPRKMIEEYRTAMRGVYSAFHGEESFKTPTRQEWNAFTASCSLRDMGIVCISTALGRADELDSDVAAAIETASSL
jgi:hypothetical protein